jgi:hypothetical protein
MRTTRGELCDSRMRSSMETGAGLNSAITRWRSSLAGSACGLSSGSRHRARAWLPPSASLWISLRLCRSGHRLHRQCVLRLPAICLPTFALANMGRCSLGRRRVCVVIDARPPLSASYRACSENLKLLGRLRPQNRLKGDHNANEEMQAKSTGAFFDGRMRRHVWRLCYVPTCASTARVCASSYAAATARL